MYSIYWIYNDVDEWCYVGSTKQTLEKRWIKYRCDHTKNSRQIDQHMRKHGFDRFHIELIEEVEPEVNHLYVEGLWITTLRDAGFKLLNKQLPQGLTPADHKRLYVERNRYKVKQRLATWRQENTERIKAWRRKQVRCPECNSQMTQASLGRHVKRYCKKV